MRWAQLQRLRFIEHRLMTGRPVQRQDIIDEFKVSVCQASVDIGEYIDLHDEGAVVYDKTLRRYVSTEKFLQIWGEDENQTSLEKELRSQLETARETIDYLNQTIDALNDRLNTRSA